MNTTLIIDGNWLLMSRLFAVKSFFDINNDTFKKEQGTAELEDLMCKSINLVINKYGKVIDNIILVADGGSWRKQIEKPSFFEEEYKGNRIKDAEIDWTYVYKSLENILEQANLNGITACKALYVEGDDWVQHWTTKLNTQGINCIIWSSDADLKQLVQVKNFAFTAWLNESQKGGLPGLILHKDLDDNTIDDIDFMFMQAERVPNKALEDLKSLSRFVTYIDPTDIVVDKVICGDKGDNIKPVFRAKKNERTYSISEKEWNNIKSDFRIENTEDFFNKKKQICEKINNIPKYAKYNVNLNNLYEMFDYNRKLVWLSDKTIPQEIQDKMNEVEYKKCDLSYIRSNYKVLCKSQEKDSNRIENIFDNVSFDNMF